MSVMQRWRAADGNGSGEMADARTADEMLEDLMEDLNNASSGTAAVQAAPPAALVDAGRRPELFQGADNGGMDPGEGQRGDQRAQGVGDGGLLGPLALPAGGLEPLVLRPEGLPPAPQGDPVVLGPAGPHGGAEQQGHPSALVQHAGHQPGSGQLLRHPSDPHGVQAVMRTPDGVGGQRNPFWSDRAMAAGDQHAASGPHGDGAQSSIIRTCENS